MKKRVFKSATEVLPEAKYVNERQAGALLGMSPHWFRADRIGKCLIPHTRIGKSARYAVVDLLAFAESRKVGGAK